jgi:signal transduction histidine kinase
VSDLLDVSRLPSGQLGPHPAPSDLGAIVRSAVDELRRLAPIWSIQPRLPARRAIMVRADVDRIHQVVANYLTNALKYGPADRPADVREQIHAGWARVCVGDQGRACRPRHRTAPPRA